MTESWDGSAWTEVADLATARSGLSGSPAGTSTAALAYLGQIPAATTATEEWTFSGIAPDAPAAGYSDAITGQMYYNSTTGQFKAIKTGGAPLGTFSSGGNLNVAKEGTAVTGTRDANIATGGSAAPGLVASTESYDGSAWTEVNDLPSSRTNGGGAGTQTAALYIAGQAPSTPYLTDVQSWNGTSWTDGTDVSQSRSGHDG